MTDRCVGMPYTGIRVATLKHRWSIARTAYYAGKLVEWRNSGGNENPHSNWYPLTDEMVQGNGHYATQRKAFGDVWDWSWMEFRISHVSLRKPLTPFYFRPMGVQHAHAA